MTCVPLARARDVRMFLSGDQRDVHHLKSEAKRVELTISTIAATHSALKYNGCAISDGLRPQSAHL